MMRNSGEELCKFTNIIEVTVIFPSLRLSTAGRTMIRGIFSLRAYQPTKFTRFLGVHVFKLNLFAVSLKQYYASEIRNFSQNSKHQSRYFATARSLVGSLKKKVKFFIQPTAPI